jgi:hypothetical protein
MAMVVSNADREESRRLTAFSRLLREFEDVYADMPCLFVILDLLVDAFGDKVLDEPFPLRMNHDYIPHIPDGFMTVAFRWLTAPRTASERNDLLLSSASCKCPDAHQQEESHRRIMQRYRSSGHHTPLAFLLHVLHIIIIAGWPRKEKKKFASKSEMCVIASGKRSEWPNKIEQVLPWGPEDTTRGVLGWLVSGLGSYFPTYLLHVMDQYLDFTQPKTMGYLLRSDTFVRGLVLGGLMQARTIFRTNDIFDKSLEDLNSFGSVLSLSTRLMYKVVTHRTNEAQRKALLWPYSRLLILMYDQLMVMSDEIESRFFLEPVMESSFAQLDFMGRLLLDDFPDMAVPSLLVFSPIQRFQQSDRQRLIHALQSVAQSYQCTSPECLNTDADVPALRICGQCRRVAYCSRQCQRRSWSHPVVPHRLICAKIRQACEAYEIPRRKAPSPMYTEPPGNFDKNIGIIIVDALSAQTTYELETSRTCPDLLVVVGCAHYVSSAMYRSEEQWNASLVARDRSVKKLITSSTTV